MSTSEKDKRLLAIEAVSQAMRTHRLGPEAIEGICQHAILFKAIGEACVGGLLTKYELDAFYGRHVRVYSDSIAYTYEERECRPESWRVAAESMGGGGFVRPYAVECAFRGNVRFTREQLEQLLRIPYSMATLREERARGAVLFPGHPDIMLEYLVKAFAPNIGSMVQVAEHPSIIKTSASEGHSQRLTVGWHLIRLEPEPLIEEASFVEQARRVDEATHRMPRAVEFATAVLLFVPLVTDGRRDGRAEKFAQGPLAQCGAWCVDKDRVLRPTSADPTRQEPEDARWVVGPYVVKDGEQQGLHLRQLEEAKRERTVQLFLVRKPDASAEEKKA